MRLPGCRFRLTTLKWPERFTAYWGAQLAAYSSASNTGMYYGRGRRRGPMVEPDRRGWTQAAPKVLLDFEPSEEEDLIVRGRKGENQIRIEVRCGGEQV